MLFSNFGPSPQQSATYYHTRLCYMQKKKYHKLRAYFEKTKSVNTQLGITNFDELLQLQNGLLYKTSNNIDLASFN
jgi:hypothetical protein